MMRSMTDTQLQAKYGYDEEPYVVDGMRSSTLKTVDMGRAYPVRSGWYNPRPECIPSRDVPGMIDAVRCDDGTWDQVELYEGAFEDAGDTSRPPVNPILSAYREYVDAFADDDRFEARARAEECTVNGSAIGTTKEVEHARKVLTRLAVIV